MKLIILLTFISLSTAISPPSDDVPEETYNAYLAFPINNPEFAQLSEDLLQVARSVSSDYSKYAKAPAKYEQRLLNLHVRERDWSGVQDIFDSKLIYELCEFMPYRQSYGGGTTINFENYQTYSVSAWGSGKERWRIDDILSSAARRHGIASKGFPGRLRILQVAVPNDVLPIEESRKLLENISAKNLSMQGAHIDRLYLCRGSHTGEEAEINQSCDVIKELKFNDCPNKNAQPPSFHDVPKEAYNAYLAFPITNPEFAKLSEDLVKAIGSMSIDYVKYAKVPAKYEQRILDLHVDDDEWDKVPKILDSKLFNEFCQYLPYYATYGEREVTFNFGPGQSYSVNSWRNVDDTNWRFDGFLSSAARRHKFVHKTSGGRMNVLEMTDGRSETYELRDKLSTSKTTRHGYIDRLYLCRGSHTGDEVTAQFCDVIGELNFNDCPKKST